MESELWELKRTSRLHLLGAAMDQFLQLVGRNIFARPRLFPAGFGRCDRLVALTIATCFGSRASAIFRLEDILEEWHVAVGRRASNGAG